MVSSWYFKNQQSKQILGTSKKRVNQQSKRSQVFSKAGSFQRANPHPIPPESHGAEGTSKSTLPSGP